LIMDEGRFKHRFVVNEHLDVAWDTEDKRVRVLVDGKPFLYCSFLIAAVNASNGEISSIDDLASVDGARRLAGKSVRDLLSVEEEVLAHASNIQAWAENGYNTRLLHSNIAFPLLRALVTAGDAKARRVLDVELTERMRDGSDTTRRAILESCGELLDVDLRAASLVNLSAHEQCEILCTIGTRLFDSGDARGSIDACREAIAIQPTHAHAWSALACGLYLSNDLHGAADACRKALDIRSDDANTWKNLGGALLALGDWNGVIDACEKALAIQPEFAEAWFNIGIARHEAGNATGAIDAHRKAIAINQGYADAWYNIGVLLLESGDATGAIHACRRAITIGPRYLQWRKVIAIDPNSYPYMYRWIHAEGMYHTTLGEALEASGNADGAVAEYRKALALDPKERNAAGHLQRLDNARPEHRTRI
jgi:tetratricopeptide (TPR) repeat protein